MKNSPALFLLLLLATGSMAQTYLPITDNMVIGSYSNIKFAAGNYVFPDAAADGVIRINGVQKVKLDRPLRYCADQRKNL
jgi:hypothetical protein